MLGATGLVGGHCLRSLLARDEFDRVVAIGRRPIDVENPKLRQQIITLDQLTGGDHFRGVTDVFCCLGTTIRKVGSQEAFRRVDHDYVVAAAEAAHAQGAKRFALVSSVGAKLKSWNFYLRVKGEVERDVSRIEFESVHIFRPSVLLGDREENRFGESFATSASKAFSFLFVGPFRKYKPIEAPGVADAMIEAVLSDQKGVRIYEFDEIVRIA